MPDAAHKLEENEAHQDVAVLPPLAGPQFEKIEPEFVRSLDTIRLALFQNFPNADLAVVERAFLFAYEAHKNQRRLSGEPYITHLLAVAEILADLHMREDVIVAGLLHDVVEDTETTTEQLRSAFGDGVAKMVDGVTKIPELKYESKEKQQAENLHKMLLSMVNDLRVILIKFADRLHNMRTIGHMTRKQQERIALETMDVYAPLAHRLGVYQVKWELEDLAFKVLNPRDYHELAEKVSLKRTERERIIQRECARIQAELRKAGVKGQVLGRPKHLYSIYTKIRTRGYPFEEILDLLAIRIIVPKMEECYFALGIVHSLYTPIQDKFTDYIATPKSNMYQSLHTKVFGPDGRKIEVQIRTEEMHSRAEYGIAAHWRYKEGDQSRKELDRQIEWLRGLLDNQAEAGDSREYLEDLKINLFEGEIFVFTPRGKLLTLPVGATPVDFAFAVHTDVGLHAMAVKINGHIAPLKATLSSGDLVEVIVSPNQKPNPDWLQFVKTSRARNKIKKWLKEQHFDESQKLGREMLQREFTRLRYKKTDKDLAETAQLFGHNTLDGFLAAIGSGDLTIENVIRKLAPEPVSSGPVANVLSKVIRRVKGSDTGIRIHGMDQVAISFGSCCQPLPGDMITGFISTGKGVVVHRIDCKNIPFLMKHPERNIQVDWDADREAKFNVRVRIMAEDRTQLLGDITVGLSKEDVNLLYIEMKREDNFASGRLVLEVKSLLHLQRVLKRIRAIPGVLHVERLDEELPGNQPM
ncbi:MAG: bifunctional (p)ppGpp synthetase/guanosine-3',5'-bis(diphosphate) 3'-pyrophosphohydrolase [bacterium]|nr:bifunctional (p)ppGpp synthetase/guanosine-3',5'-bis(diphosphate) 3'-pyrophosphohydrolase [bacterium]